MKHYTPRSKINRDVARHVMGWKLVNEKDDWCDTSFWEKDGKSVMPATNFGASDGDYGFNPAARIEHAMMVWDELLTHPDIDGIYFRQSKSCRRRVFILINKIDNTLIASSGKTKSEAICLAALRAKGVKGY